MERLLQGLDGVVFSTTSFSKLTLKHRVSDEQGGRDVVLEENIGQEGFLSPEVRLISTNSGTDLN